MLRMGKNPNEDKSQTQTQTHTDADSYSTRSYSPYQSNETQARPATENAASPKALTESETIAREIKDGSLSGFVGSGTVIAGQRIELGRAAKLNGNIQTPSLVIEQGAVFEGSCKMVQMKTAATPKVERKENVIDASNAIKVDASKKSEEG